MLVAFAAAALIGPGRGWSQDLETAALSPFDIIENEAALPRILTETDIARYRHILALQEDERWADADREVRRLVEPILTGHVMARRLLHPKYHASYDELKSWLELYADHPDARTIYRLAMARKPARAKAPPAPNYVSQPPAAESADPRTAGYVSSQHRSAAERARAQQFMARVKGEALNGRIDAAARMLEGPEAAKILDPVEMDLTRANVASRYFYAGEVPEAYELATPAAKRSGAKAPTTNWIAGLAAYRQGKYIEAARYFEAQAAGPHTSNWTASAAAFWAARANLVGQRPERVSRWLQQATRYPHTFYGLLAHRLLGTKPETNFAPERLTARDIAMLLREQPARRAFALIQIGETHVAELELRPLAYRNEVRLNTALVALAERVAMPSLALRVAINDNDPDTGMSRHPGALYPIPGWKPNGGFSVDRAMIYAFMRQESAFNVRATSPVGARGLMQLMPATASFMANERLRGGKTSSLYDPELNIALGQKYLNHLLEHETVQGDLFRLAAAYNGGPGNLAKWDRRSDNMTDSLMFIESIPAHETRNFIERVLSNLWIYQIKLGQDSPSLDAIASGERPLYEALDGKPAKAARLATNGRN